LITGKLPKITGKNIHFANSGPSHIQIHNRPSACRNSHHLWTLSAPEFAPLLQSGKRLVAGFPLILEACLASLKITYKAPAQLRPRARNPRTHTANQIKQIQASIKEFGFINPILIDATDGIIAGHGRVEAAKLVGMRDVPTVRVDHLTPAQIRAYVIADNKLAENAGWDRELLTLELQELSVELNFDVTVTGFETAEIDVIIGELTEDTSDDADELPEIDRSAPAVTRLGDCWRIGNHLLLCGDALKADSYNQLLGDSKAPSGVHRPSL